MSRANPACPANPEALFNPGPLIQTENQFDLALTGDAFFVLDGPTGPVWANVDAVQEMIAMMIGMRQYEAAEKSLRAMSEAMALNARPQG